MQRTEGMRSIEELVALAVEKIRASNGCKLYLMPEEASARQVDILSRELSEKNPWHKVIIIRHVAPGQKDSAADGERKSIDELRQMIETPWTRT